MVRVLSTVAFLVGSLSAITTVQAVYQTFDLDTSVVPTFVDPIAGTSLVQSSSAETSCDAVDTCLGYICRSDNPVCVLLAYDKDNGVLQAPEAGYASVSYRYDTPSGPSCSSFLDTFVNAQGECTCESELQRQDTGFGCRAINFASQLPERRKRSNRIMPGHVQRAAFERVRVRA